MKDVNQGFARLLRHLGESLSKKHLEYIVEKYGYIGIMSEGDGVAVLRDLWEAEVISPSRFDALRSLLNECGASELSDGVNEIEEEMNSLIGTQNDDSVDLGFSQRLDGRVKRSIFKAIGEAIEIPGETEQTNLYSLCGQDGIGKTQLALWLCDSCRDRFEVIWWIDSCSEERFKVGMDKLANSLGLPTADSDDDATLRTSELCDELNSRGNWMLVLDDFDGIEVRDLIRNLPKRGGVVILTTEDISLLPEELSFLVPSLTAAEVHSVFNNVTNCVIPYELTEEVGSLFEFNTLSLSLCAHLINFSVSGEDSGPENVLEVLLRILNERRTENPWDVLIEISLTEIREKEPAAWRLLTKISLCGCKGMAGDIVESMAPTEKIRTWRVGIPPWKGEIRPSKRSVNDSLSELLGRGLVYMKGEYYTAHKRIRNTVLEFHTGEEGDVEELLAEVIRDLKRQWDFWHSDPDAWRLKELIGDLVEDLYAQVYFCQGKSSDIGRGEVEGNGCKMDVVLLLTDYAKYLALDIEAEMSVEKFNLSSAERVLMKAGSLCLSLSFSSKSGDSEENTLDFNRIHNQSSNHVVAEGLVAIKRVQGYIHEMRGNSETALRSYRDALFLETELKGRASLMTQAGSCLERAGKFYEALEEYKSALEIWGQIMLDEIDNGGQFGIVESSALHDNISMCLSAVGSYSEALEHLEESLRLRVVAYKGEENTAVAACFNNIGVVQSNLRDYDASLQLKKKALEIYERVYGEGAEHEDIAMCLHNLGALCYKMERYSESQRYYKKALKLRQKILGVDHETTTKTAESLEECRRILRRKV